MQGGSKCGVVLRRNQSHGAGRVVKKVTNRTVSSSQEGLRTGQEHKAGFMEPNRRQFRISAGPVLFDGSKTKSEEHLRKSLTYDPNSTATHYFLADALFDMNRDAEARKELQAVIDAPIDPEWAPEDRDFNIMARARLNVN